jgi:hypothetical protein
LLSATTERERKRQSSIEIKCCQPTKKWKLTAEEILLAQDKRITAGLIAAAGKFQLPEENEAKNE